MQTDAYISKKMRLMSFIAACAIVLIHAGIMPHMDHQAAWCREAINIYTHKLTCWAVPFFFLAAGFWFARGNYEGYKPFLKKKCRSLVLPYFCWAVIGLILNTPAVVLANSLANRPLVTNTVFESGSFWSITNNIFAFTIAEPKQLGVLWFIRTLFLAMFYQSVDF